MALRSQDVPFSSDRILFSVDSPYGRMTELAPWFDSCPISEIDRQKIADYRGGVTCLARTQFFRRTGRFSVAFSGLRHLWRESP